MRELKKERILNSIYNKEIEDILEGRDPLKAIFENEPKNLPDGMDMQDFENWNYDQLTDQFGGIEPEGEFEGYLVFSDNMGVLHFTPKDNVNDGWQFALDITFTEIKVPGAKNPVYQIDVDEIREENLPDPEFTARYVAFVDQQMNGGDRGLMQV